MDAVETAAAAGPPETMMVNPHGHLVPVRLIQPAILLEDQLVKELCSKALKVQATLQQFRAGAFSDADEFMSLLAEKYGAKPRSAANTTLTSFDGLQKVEVSTGHFLALGPELQSAKSLIDECLTEWSAGGNENLRVIVNQAFDVGAEGRVRVDRILGLRRLEINDAKWRRAMDAIGDAVRTTHSKRYIRFHTRPNTDAAWSQITLDVARVP